MKILSFGIIYFSLIAIILKAGTFLAVRLIAKDYPLERIKLIVWSTLNALIIFITIIAILISF